jgi:hypothetical protein
MTPQPYAGEARVVASRKRSGHRVAGVAVSDSRFRKRLDPGRYRLAVRIDDPCWESDPIEVTVRRDRFKRVRMIARNECIL